MNANIFHGRVHSRCNHEENAEMKYGEMLIFSYICEFPQIKIYILGMSLMMVCLRIIIICWK